MNTQTKYTTKQQIFDKVWQHFVVNKNPKSVNEHTHCVYSSPEGGCAIGCLIDNDALKKEFDAQTNHTSIYSIRDRFNIELSDYIDPSIKTRFLDSLQTIHDSYFDSFEENMRALAAKYNLKVPKTK
jgi:hypothetical protein